MQPQAPCRGETPTGIRSISCRIPMRRIPICGRRTDLVSRAPPGSAGIQKDPQPPHDIGRPAHLIGHARERIGELARVCGVFFQPVPGARGIVFDRGQRLGQFMQQQARASDDLPHFIRRCSGQRHSFQPGPGEKSPRAITTAEHPHRASFASLRLRQITALSGQPAHKSSWPKERL